MNKCLIISDSFKGCLTSMEVAHAAAKSIKSYFPKCEIQMLPLADGGEGTLEAFLNVSGGSLKKVKVYSEAFQPQEASYGIKNKVAVIEMAKVVALPKANLNVSLLERSTYGVGQLIDDAIKSGCKTIYLALGGSSTVDMGLGIIAALGGEFYDQQNQSIQPLPLNFAKIKRIELQAVKEKLTGIKIIGLADIDNKMLGEDGAIEMYSTQKGGTSAEICQLTAGCRHILSLCSGVEDQPRFGAAGCTGFSVSVLLEGSLQSGIDAILDYLNVDEQLLNTDLVITGEGSFDEQSFCGKAISGIAKRTKLQNIPLIVLTGQINGDISKCYEAGISGVFCINQNQHDFLSYQDHASQRVTQTMNNLLSTFYMVD